MSPSHREGVKIAVIVGLITSVVGLVGTAASLGKWGGDKASKDEVKRIELLTLANEKRISLLELQAEQSLQVNTELLKLLQERRAARSGGGE